MGIRYCDDCDARLEFEDSWNDCQAFCCPASGKQICNRCADTSKPTCNEKDCEGTCSMCPTMHPYVMVEGYDGYMSELAPKCTLVSCPVYNYIRCEDKCRSCWERYTNSLGCCVENTHKTFTFKCGHESCLARQNQMKCKEGECAECKEDQLDRIEKEKRLEEEDAISKDVDIMRKCLGNVSSESAKAALEEWLKKNALVDNTGSSKKRKAS